MPTEPLPGPLPETLGTMGLLLFVLAGIFAAADRGAVFVERWGPRVCGLRRLTRRWARSTVEREQRDEALARIAEMHEPLMAIAQQSEAIRLALGTNGKPLHDRMTEMQSEIRVINRRLERGDEHMARIDRRLEALEGGTP